MVGGAFIIPLFGFVDSQLEMKVVIVHIFYFDCWIFLNHSVSEQNQGVDVFRNIFILVQVCALNWLCLLPSMSFLLSVIVLSFYIITQVADKVSMSKPRNKSFT